MRNAVCWYGGDQQGGAEEEAFHLCGPQSTARALPDVFNICHALSNAAVKIFVVAGLKKLWLLRSSTISMAALPSRRERDGSLSHRRLFIVFLPMMQTVSAHSGRIASLVFPTLKHLDNIINFPKSEALPTAAAQRPRCVPEGAGSRRASRDRGPRTRPGVSCPLWLLNIRTT